MILRYCVVLMTAIMVSACTHMGPQTVKRDRFDYNAAISGSWKEQTLLNIVKLRYADMPLFVEVVSVVSGYSLEGSVNLAGTIPLDTGSGDVFSLGTTGKYTDRPTITYAPIKGSQFNKSFMVPIPPSAILFMMQSGWSADLIFALTVDSVNGLRSRMSAGPNQRLGDVGFYRVIELLGQIQKSGAIGMRIKRATDLRDTTVMFFHREMLSPEVESALNELSGLLGLQSGLRETRISYGFLPETDSEIAMLTRSMLHIMIDLATQIDVPARHVAEGRTVPSLPRSTKKDEQARPRLITIRNSIERPETVFTAVKYRDHWFWIDDRDFHSKRTFAFLMILFSLMETGGKEGMPLVTIPAG